MIDLSLGLTVGLAPPVLALHVVSVTMAKALRTYSRSRLEEVCERRGHPDRADEIAHLDERTERAAEALAVLTGLALAALLGATVGAGRPLAWPSRRRWAIALALGGLGYVAAGRHRPGPRRGGPRRPLAPGPAAPHLDGAPDGALAARSRPWPIGAREAVDRLAPPGERRGRDPLHRHPLRPGRGRPQRPARATHEMLERVVELTRLRRLGGDDPALGDRRPARLGHRRGPPRGPSSNPAAAASPSSASIATTSWASSTPRTCSPTSSTPRAPTTAAPQARPPGHVRPRDQGRRRAAGGVPHAARPDRHRPGRVRRRLRPGDAGRPPGGGRRPDRRRARRPDARGPRRPPGRLALRGRRRRSTWTS